MKTQSSRRGATLREVRSWPATVDVEDAARALGISRASAYNAIAIGDFPGETIRVNRRLRVLTASLIEVLEGGTSDRAISA
ncbi:MAG: helix-turn-helix domain-containing protein [Streptosporangiaceae bacterium]